MRRLLSIVLLAILVLGSAISALPGSALGAGWASGWRSGWTGKTDESRLPACCRRGGKHHCAMSAMASAGETSVSSNDPCPFAPQTMAATAPTLAAVLGTTTDSARLAGELCVLLAAVAFAVLASRRSEPKRGPPVLCI